MLDLGNRFDVGFGQAFRPKLIEGKALLRCRYSPNMASWCKLHFRHFPFSTTVLRFAIGKRISDRQALKIPPLVCSPFNADFDGQMLRARLRTSCGDWKPFCLTSPLALFHSFRIFTLRPTMSDAVRRCPTSSSYFKYFKFCFHLISQLWNLHIISQCIS